MTPRSRIASTPRAYAGLRGPGPGRSAGRRQEPRLDPLLENPSGRALRSPYDVGSLARRLRDRLDQLGAAVDQADAVVGAMGQTKRAVRHELVDERSPPLLGVVVNTVVIGQQCKTVRHRV